MKTLLQERTEIAKALNFGKYPVLEIDLDNKPYEEENYCKGGLVRIAWDNPRYEGMTSKCYLELSEGKYQISQYGRCLKADYSIADFLKSVKTANTPLIHKDEIVAIAHYSRKLNVFFVKLMKVSSRIDVHCQVVTTLCEII